MNKRNGMSESEAGKLGFIASRKTVLNRIKNAIEEYDKSPKLCKQCGKPLPYDKRMNTFCSLSCAATHTNFKNSMDPTFRYKMSITHGGSGGKFKCRNCGKLLNVDQHVFCSQECKDALMSVVGDLMSTNKAKLIDAHICPICGRPIPEKKRKSIYCSIDCFIKGKWIATRKQIESTHKFPFNERLNETNRRIVRKYLEETVGHKCSICGRTTWMDKDIPLVVDHIDGDATNHNLDNFRLVCQNCDALLPTFKNRGNRMSTRVWRKSYYTK